MTETQSVDDGDRSFDASVHQFAIENVPVVKIRPEDGLGRKRDRDGHAELQRSIAQFGVLTPITVRRARDGDDFLLIKGQGRTLACRMLGLETIPAMVVDDRFSDNEKVQQFLVENVARLKMRPVDRALLIHRARSAGEETGTIARRFGISAATVRRLATQLEGVSANEVRALRDGEISLALHAVIARFVARNERAGVMAAVAMDPPSPRELETLFVALGWSTLTALGPSSLAHRLVLLAWACKTISRASGSLEERLSEVASQFPTSFSSEPDSLAIQIS
ncbi:ParB/RepB/Spo0J family partition protein [Micromonospora sp. DT81.3]|uniref:ParB/RepB/Spo0J family partition protein n=1 Tax=Micromonospora sp. DT81.3 TaxID=3416523 RepID=UPI003CEAED35